MSNQDKTGAYKPLQFYKEAASADIKKGFDKFSKGGEHFFAYKVDGQVVLVSSGYASESERDNGIEALEQSRLSEASYKRSKANSFNLIASGQELAASAAFASANAMEAVISRLMGNASSAVAADSVTSADPQAAQGGGMGMLLYALPVIIIALLIWFFYLK